MRTVNFALRTGLLCLVLAGLAGCDDDDDDEPAPPPTAGDSFVITSATSGQRVLSFNRAAPGTVRTAATISGLAADERIVGADFRPADGKLYAVTSANRVVVLDTGSGAVSAPVTLSGATLDGAAGTRFGVDFNPVPDRLRVVSSTGQNLRINLADGSTTVDGTLKLDRRTATTPDVSGVTAVAYSNTFREACRTTIYYLDSSAGRLLTATDPNAGTVFAVGSLGVVAGDIDGFDVITGTAADGLPTNTAVAVLSVNGVPTLHSIDLASGAAAALGALGVASGEQVVALAVPTAASPSSQTRGELAALTAGDRLLTFNRGSPAKACTGPTAVSGLGGGETLLGIDLRPATGELYALSSSSRLLVIDPVTAVATARSTLSTALPADAAFGVDFNPVPDRLRVVGSSGANLRIDPRAAISPNITADTSLSGSSSANVTAVAYTNSVNGGGENVNTGAATTLFGVDSTRDVLVRIGSDPANGTPGDPGNPNSGVVSDIGPLTVDIEALNALEIDGVNGQALLAAHSAGATGSRLFSLNPASGAATLVTGAAASSTISGGELVKGLALLPVQTATVFALLENGLGLISLRPSEAAAPSAAVAISGLAAGESLLDIDFRVTGNSQRNRQLIGVSDQNRLYRIDPLTGAASNGRALRDASGTDVALNSTTTGVDFNPVPDLLRVISAGSPQQNLRINVDSDTGTTADSPISGAATGLFGAAYANNFVGTTSTVLYALDATTASLVRIGGDPADGAACPNATNPNCGVATLIGALGAAAPAPLSGLGDMDIVGGRNGYALAAVQPAAGGTSTLLRVNLSSGAATSLGTIAAPGGAAVRSIAVRLQ